MGIPGSVSAIDINKGRLRILSEAAKLQKVDNVVTTVHADLRTFAVCYFAMKSGSLFLNHVHLSDLLLSSPSRTIIRLSRIKFCWMLHVLDSVFFPRCTYAQEHQLLTYLSRASFELHLRVFCLLFSHKMKLRAAYSVSSVLVAESRLALESEMGGYGTTEGITRWTS